MTKLKVSWKKLTNMNLKKDPCILKWCAVLLMGQCLSGTMGEGGAVSRRRGDMHFLFIFVIIILKPSSCFCQNQRSFFIFCLKLQSFSTNCKKVEISIEVCKDMNHCVLILICIYFAIFLTLVGVSFCKYF